MKRCALVAKTVLCLISCHFCGCWMHVQAGLSTTRLDAPVPGLVIQTHGLETPQQTLNFTPGSTLKIGPDAVDLSLVYGLTYHQPIMPGHVIYLRGQVDVLNIGYDFGNPYPHIGTFGPGLAIGYMKQDKDREDRWWSLGAFLDHDVRFGPGHQTYMGLNLGYAWVAQ